MSEPQILFRTDVHVEGATLVYSFEGWTDSGGAASMALAYLNKKCSGQVFAEFLPDGLFDYRSRRPIFSVTNGISQGLAWPQVTFAAGSLGDSHPLVTLSGPEPDINWQTFSKMVAEAAHKLGIGMAIGLGAIPAPVPHTRVAPIISTSADPDLVARVGALDGSAQVPASVQLAIEAAIDDRGIPSMCIWARVPHYVAQMAWPQASVALLDTLKKLVGVELDLDELSRSAEEASARIDEAVRQNKEAAEYVAQLERLFGEEETRTTGPSGLSEFGLVTGDQIASEIEQFLSRYNDKGDDKNREGNGSEPGSSRPS